MKYQEGTICSGVLKSGCPIPKLIIDFVKNYKIGVRSRRQAYRDFLFWEVEPSYNWRVDEAYFDRVGAWRIELRMEFLLFDNPGETLEKQIL